MQIALRSISFSLIHGYNCSGGLKATDKYNVISVLRSVFLIPKEKMIVERMTCRLQALSRGAGYEVLDEVRGNVPYMSKTTSPSQDSLEKQFLVFERGT